MQLFLETGLRLASLVQARLERPNPVLQGFALLCELITFGCSRLQVRTRGLQCTFTQFKFLRSLSKQGFSLPQPGCKLRTLLGRTLQVTLKLQALGRQLLYLFLARFMRTYFLFQLLLDRLEHLGQFFIRLHLAECLVIKVFCLLFQLDPFLFILGQSRLQGGNIFFKLRRFAFRRRLRLSLLLELIIQSVDLLLASIPFFGAFGDHLPGRL